MKRVVLRESDFVPAATNRRDRGKPYMSKDLAPANLTDTQEGAVLTLFRVLRRAPYGSEAERFLRLTEGM